MSKFKDALSVEVKGGGGEMDQAFLCRGQGRNDTYGPENLCILVKKEKRRYKKKKSRQFISPGVQHGESMVFQGSHYNICKTDEGNSDNKGNKYPSPFPDPQDNGYGYDREQEKVRNGIQSRAQVALRFRFPRDIAVQNIAESAEKIDHGKQQRIVKCKKQEEQKHDPADGENIRNVFQAATALPTN